MFGHQDDDKDEDSKENAMTAPEVVPDNAGGGAADSTPTDQTPDDGSMADTPAPDTEEQTPADDGATDDTAAWQHPGEPVDDTPEPINDIIAPAGGAKPSFHLPVPQHKSDDEATSNTPHELIDIKEKALNGLLPLMGQLDQTPEDKFRTTMMIIQASDDQKLIKTAYEAADGIKDEKLRAQALLDLVNEINYFTQPPATEN